MKILSAAQIREADQYTIAHEPIASIDLMERAASVFVKWFTEKFPRGRKVKIFCGMGNNGGDGLAIARMLLGKGYDVEVYIVRYANSASADFLVNAERLKNQLPLQDITAETPFPEITKDDIVVDALWGSGLNRPITGFAANLIEHLNSSSATRIAIDIPSGLYADRFSDSVKFKADFTLSFELPKLAFLLPSGAEYAGEWTVKSIGLHQGFIQNTDTDNFLVTAELVKPFIRTRKKFDHKGTFGHALLFCGSYGKIGAARLCTEACLRAGAGMATACIPRCGYTALQTAVSEAMVVADKEENFLSAFPELHPFSAIGAGPGIGTNPVTAQALKKLLENTQSPLVLDADALNILAQNKEWLKILPPNCILTPHPKEFERLFGKTANDFERLALQKSMARQYQVYIILKLAHTSICTPQGITYFNTTGNPGMATAGSGDVLTGIITGLLCQGYPPDKSAILGVYWHGLAGDFAAEQLGQPSMIAGDIIHHLGNAFKKISGS
ncbi:MAG: bifunctional NAD(P)H-hydrate repair enzyme [Chitinophagales bacterium]|nr:MAG: bifunctional NAD(P)H-hydrate repair enzyme [Chitinophagales bacterium]